MIRTALVIVLLAMLVMLALVIAGEPGQASAEWMGWRVDMTAVAAATLLIFGALAFTLFWRLALWIAEAPRRTRRHQAEVRRRQGAEALARGFLAAAAGDGSEARRLAQKAADLADESPALVRVLAAQAAEAAGDVTAARAAYQAMLGFPEMRLAGLKGLVQLAIAQNDRQGALRYAQEAYSLGKTARWAWRALLEDRLEHADWSEALGLVKSALDRKIVPPIVAERARASLLAASAANLETADPERRGEALEFALQSAKLMPDFAPGVVMAARLLTADGKASKAASLIEAAWRDSPHPALWLAYRDLSMIETPKERAKRLEGLAQLNPDARESRILMVEQALLSGGPLAIRDAALRLPQEQPPTARMCGLRARLAYALGNADEARAWVARGAGAAQEPDWSDLDPEGHAFAYTPADWARLVTTYAETGELIHPRYERAERAISDLPDLPMAYEAAVSFVEAAETGLGIAPIPDDPGPYPVGYEDGEADLGQGRAAERRRGPVRRRLAGVPRAVK